MATEHKKNYEVNRKEVSDEKDNYKPKHTSALILCLLQQLIEELESLKKANLFVQSLIEEIGKKKK